jgi:hypothetical protein
MMTITDNFGNLIKSPIENIVTFDNSTDPKNTLTFDDGSKLEYKPFQNSLIALIEDESLWLRFKRLPSSSKYQIKSSVLVQNRTTKSIASPFSIKSLNPQQNLMSDWIILQHESINDYFVGFMNFSIENTTL